MDEGLDRVKYACILVRSKVSIAEYSSVRTIRPATILRSPPCQLFFKMYLAGWPELNIVPGQSIHVGLA
ncbi:hypothetical protein M8818_000071 [Zalaria obscura]|uniref:Uncharacterized protein n=1 Tax=Zalaria obscura TaxID=2024903 RepID=A0ACC3SNL0_9PEZI